MKNNLPSTDTRAIESYINNGGAIGEAEKSIARGNVVASQGVSAGVAVGKATIAGSTALKSVLTTVGVSSSAVPVAGWIIAGVLIASSGVALLSSKRRAKFLNKDRKLFEKYVKRFERKSEQWRLKEAREQISLLQFLQQKKQNTFNLKRKAKAELKLEALFFIYKEKNYSRIQQQAIDNRASQLLNEKKKNLLIYSPLYVGLFATGIILVYKALQKRR